MFFLKRIRYFLLILLVAAVAVFFRWNGRVSLLEEGVGWFNAEFTGVSRSLSLVLGPSGDLKRELAENETERARLRARLAQSQEEAGRLKFMLGLRGSAFAGEKTGVVARVVARDPETWQISVITDRGLDHGVRKGYIALTGDGLAGRVTEVTAVTSKVLLITGAGSATSVVMPAKSVYGIAYGDGTGLLDIRYLPSSTRLRRGTLAATSGYGGNYPAGLPVGRVVGFRVVSEELSPRVRVKPAADTANLYFLLLVAP